jgi:hypothetical protein
MFFADDVVLVDENRMGVDQKFSCGDELWRQNVLGLVGLKWREYLIIRFLCFFTFVASIRSIDELIGIVDLLLCSCLMLFIKVHLILSN